MLEKFRKAKAAEIDALQSAKQSGTMPSPYTGQRPGFTASLKTKAPCAVIAEYKRASPSKGDINLSVMPEDAAALYAMAGAGAISVLTEQNYFKGDIAFLGRMTAPGLPLLRKDFIFHPLQIEATLATPASAVLLIVRMLDTPTLRAMIAKCTDSGLEAVVEIFDATDLQRAREAGASIIQVNNRDLATLRVDTGVSVRLAAHKKSAEFWITASGVERREQLSSLLGFGFDAALVGSSLMQGGNPGEALAALTGAADNG